MIITKIRFEDSPSEICGNLYDFLMFCEENKILVESITIATNKCTIAKTIKL